MLHLAITLLCAAITFAAGLAALIVMFVFRRIPRRSGRVAAAAFVAGVAAWMTGPARYDPGEMDPGFAPALEHYRAEHGRYPSTLEAAGIETPATRYGPLRYDAGVDAAGRPKYSLSAGDYYENGFVSGWESGRAMDSWYLDQ